jgi:iron-sulfur cluster repair protein YtfE (RIC family)
MTDDALETRPGLPDALQVLLRDHPRATWESDPRFHGLVSFWLDRHLAFRHLIGRMQAETRAFLDNAGTDPRTYAGRLSRLGGQFVGDLHGHHMIEDQHYFPRLAAIAPRIGHGFAILDRDHQALDGHIDTFVKGANAILNGLDAPAMLLTRVGRFGADLDRMDGFLNRHLLDEEDLIVPVILKHGEAALGG